MENIQNNVNKNFNKKQPFDNLSILSKKIENMEKIEKEHRDVIEYMRNVNQKASQEVLVPVCNDLAYYLGKIKNPNECKVYLGEDYFVKTKIEKAINILSNRVNKTKDILANLNKEISSGIVIESTKEKKETSENLKQLHDDTFEIVEDASQMDIQNITNIKTVEQTVNDDKKREILINEKFEKLKVFEKEKETPIIMSVVRRKCTEGLKLSNTHIQNKTDIKITQNVEERSRNYDGIITKVTGKKKKDVIDSNINSQLNYSGSFSGENEENKLQKSYFYDLVENEL